MAHVYRVVLPDGQEFAWHAGPGALRKEYPDAQIIGRLKMDKTGQGSWAASEGNEPEEGTTDYETLTVAQLRDAAEQRGVDVTNGAKKADLVAALQASDAEGAQEPAPDDSDQTEGEGAPA